MNQQVTQPPPPPPYEGQAQSPIAIANYLVQSILVTLFCCLPLGVVAIVFAAQVNGKIQAGDIQGAMDSSKKAKLFCWLSLGIGLLGVLAYIGLVAVGVMAEM